jgi:hypothetical protein
MEELGDNELAQLVSMGGWIRGTEVLTSIVRKTYTPDSAELLHQPLLLEYFSKQLGTLSSKRLSNDRFVVRVRKMLEEIRPLIGAKDGNTISLDNVQKINEMTRDTVISITGKGA